MGDLGMLGLRYDPKYGGADETRMHYLAKQLGF